MDLSIIKLISDGGLMVLVAFVVYIIWQISNNHLATIQKTMESLVDEIKGLREEIKYFINKK